MSELALYKIKTINRQGVSTSRVIPVTPASKEPTFGKLAIFSAERRDHMEYRASLLADVNYLIKSGLRSQQDIAPEILSGVPALDTATLEVLIDAFSGDDGGVRLLEFLEYSSDCSVTKKREIAKFWHFFWNMKVQFAEAILDRIRAETFPVFAYEDFTEMSKQEIESFILVLRFYVHAFYQLTATDLYFDGGLLERHTTYRSRELTLSSIPALTPEFVGLLTEYPDWSKQEEIIQFTVQRDMTTFDADPIRSFLSSPSQALREGVL
jgi:hypothetical protein